MFRTRRFVLLLRTGILAGHAGQLRNAELSPFLGTRLSLIERLLPGGYAYNP